MIRPFTCLTLVAAMGAGLYLYQEKHRAQLLDRQIGHVVRQAEQGRDRIGVLQAEWAWLNERDRLNGLATQHLQLQVLAPAQYARMEDLRSRLPAITPPPADPPVEEPLAAAVSPPAARAPGVAPGTMPGIATTVAAVVAPASSPLAAQIAASNPSPAAPLAPPAAPVVLAAAAPARPAPAARPPRPVAAKPREAEPAIAAPRPFFAPVMPAYQPTPVVVHAPTVQTASAIGLPQQPTPFVGSSLGMARTALAAPVPVSVASNGAPGYATAR